MGKKREVFTAQDNELDPFKSVSSFDKGSHLLRSLAHTPNHAFINTHNQHNFQQPTKDPYNGKPPLDSEYFEMNHPQRRQGHLPHAQQRQRR